MNSVAVFAVAAQAVTLFFMVKTCIYVVRHKSLY